MTHRIDFERYGLVDPTMGRDLGAPGATPVAAGGLRADVTLRGLTIGYLWNGKQNGNILLDAIAEKITADYGARRLSLEAKLVPSQPAPDEVIARFIAEADCVVTGPGD